MRSDVRRDKSKKQNYNGFKGQESEVLKKMMTENNKSKKKKIDN